eukprot:tig00001128_g7197.t1
MSTNSGLHLENLRGALDELRAERRLREQLQNDVRRLVDESQQQRRAFEDLSVRFDAQSEQLAEHAERLRRLERLLGAGASAAAAPWSEPPAAAPTAAHSSGLPSRVGSGLQSRPPQAAWAWPAPARTYVQQPLPSPAAVSEYDAGRPARGEASWRAEVSARSRAPPPTPNVYPPDPGNRWAFEADAEPAAGEAMVDEAGAGAGAPEPALPPGVAAQSHGSSDAALARAVQEELDREGAPAPAPPAPPRSERDGPAAAMREADMLLAQQEDASYEAAMHETDRLIAMGISEQEAGLAPFLDPLPRPGPLPLRRLPPPAPPAIRHPQPPRPPPPPAIQVPDEIGGEEGYEALLALQEQIGHVSRGVPPHTVAQFPRRQLRPGDIPRDERERERHRDRARCAVCMEDYEAGESVRTVPCMHFFHAPCIDRWLADHPDCPICKGDLREQNRYRP